MKKYKDIEQMVLAHEGLRLKPYRCPAGKLTIGVGRNIEDRGITPSEAMLLLRNDLQECENDLKTIFVDWNPALLGFRAWALVDMRFQLGGSGFRKFKKMIAAVKNRDWEQVAIQAEDSRWFKQVPRRAKEIVAILRTGEL
jgi:lysozyme